MKKRFLAALMAGAMAALSVGAVPASAEENKLTVWAWDPANNLVAMQLAADMYAETHEGFELEIVETQSQDCETKLTTAANAGDYSTMADIILMQDNSYQKFLKSYPDAFVDVSDIAINWDDFAALKQTYSMVDGKHYAVPFDNGAAAGFYRTDILAEAGYTLADLTDITWSRFIEIGKDLYAKTGKYLLSTDVSGSDMMMMMIQSCGSNYVNEAGEAYIVGNEAASACVDLYVEMIQSNVIKLCNNWDEYIASITNGETAGIVQGNWISGTLLVTEDQKGLWQVTNIPKVDGIETATNYSNQGGSSWYITANCKNVDLAKDFLATTFGSSTEFYDAVLNDTGMIACYMPAGESDAYNQEHEYFAGQKYFSTIVEYSGQIPTFTTTPFHYEAGTAITTAVINIINGTAKEEALQAAQDTLAFQMMG